MRRKRPQEKIVRDVAIPDELREALDEVRHIIQAAANDPDVDLEHGDAIQVPRILCGGRYGAPGRRYVFTYYPSGDGDRGRWFLTLSDWEIDTIADGNLRSLSLLCCASADCRSKFRENSETCFYCDYFDDPTFGSFKFPQAAEILRSRDVDGISQQSSRADVVALLGEPTASGEVRRAGRSRPWANYDCGDFKLRIDFDAIEGPVHAIWILEGGD